MLENMNEMVSIIWPNKLNEIELKEKIVMDKKWFSWHYYIYEGVKIREKNERKQPFDC